MMKGYPRFSAFFTAALIAFQLLGACTRHESPAQFYHPADFENIKSTCFVWSPDHLEIIPKLISVISQNDPVTIFIGETGEDTAAISAMLKKHESNFSNIQFIKLKNKPDNIWLRDYGPVYLTNRLGDKKLVNFTYFGTRPPLVYDFALKMNIPITESTLNSTGGAREVNGKGTVILCETHELDVNKPKTKMDIEKELIEKLALKKIIWLKRGIPQDDNPLTGPLHEQIYPNGVNGHVDEFCRFANSNTILISSVTDRESKQHPILAEAKKRLDETYDILQKATDQDGKKFKVIKVPYAPLHIVDRSTQSQKIFVATVTSYMNFIVTNSMVILPSYYSENPTQPALRLKEDEVTDIFRKAFPSKEIKLIPIEGLNYFSGGFHCLSINEPKVNS